MKTKEHAKRIGEMIYGVVKRVFRALRKSPEIQLMLVLLLGVMAGSLIIYGFTINDAGLPAAPMTSSVAQNIMYLVEFSGQIP